MNDEEADTQRKAPLLHDIEENGVRDNVLINEGNCQTYNNPVTKSPPSFYVLYPSICKKLKSKYNNDRKERHYEKSKTSSHSFRAFN